MPAGEKDNGARYLSEGVDSCTIVLTSVWLECVLIHTMMTMMTTADDDDDDDDDDDKAKN